MTSTDEDGHLLGARWGKYGRHGGKDSKYWIEEEVGMLSEKKGF